MIPDAGTLAVFCGAALALTVVPGPAVVYIVGSAIDGGRRAGAASVVGIEIGTLFHVAAASLGLSGLLAASALAFDTVKYLGAAYLTAVGLWLLFREIGDARRGTIDRSTSHRRRVAQGILVQILNPKTALFFLAFLPQFVDSSAGRVWLQLLFLGLVFVMLGTATDLAWVFLVGFVRNRVRDHRGFLRTQRYVSGTVFVGLGVATALAGSYRAPT